MNKKITVLSILVVIGLFLSSCSGQKAVIPSPEVQENQVLLPTETKESPQVEPPVQVTETSAPTFTPTPQPVSDGFDYGPQIGDFPPGVNPLTGLPVSDPVALELPAVMLSVPLFPPSSRPQAGISFAPWVYEIYIGEGMTRLLVSYYGEDPQVRSLLTGTCPVRTDPFIAGSAILGNRVWLDANRNGVQDPGEPAIGGICIMLYDSTGKILQTTSTDSNGFFGFNVDPGQTFRLGFEHPDKLGFTTPDVSMDDADSDVDPLTGLTPPISFSRTDMDWDAGYLTSTAAPSTTLNPGTMGAVSSTNPDPGITGAVSSQNLVSLPPAEIGPIRSMRLPYGTIGRFFAGGCIVSASGDPSVLAQVKGCYYAHGDDSNINGTLLDITKMRQLAETNQNPIYPVNYSGNLFSSNLPQGGLAANQVNVFWNIGDQSRFNYDPLSGAYQRFLNLPDKETEYFPQTDRLTGQQLLYDNVILMYVEHKAYAETKIDISIGLGDMGAATLFRDGQIFHIHWSTIAQEYEQQTQRLRPIRFTDASGNPVPLKPGHTWVHVFTTASVVYEKQPGSGIWSAVFHAPSH